MPNDKPLTDLGVSGIRVRQESANGQPPARSKFFRSCKRCDADFLGLAPGKTGERGLWKDWAWFCSQECYDKRETR